MLGDGNLVLIEGLTLGGGAEQVEVALGNEDSWASADVAADDAGRWRFLWSDPAPGFHRVRARTLGSGGAPLVEQSIIVQVQDTSSTAYVIDNPYATAGRFMKGPAPHALERVLRRVRRDAAGTGGARV